MRGVAFLRFGQDSLDYLCLMRAITDPTKKKPEATASPELAPDYTNPDPFDFENLDSMATGAATPTDGPLDYLIGLGGPALVKGLLGRAANTATKNAASSLSKVDAARKTMVDGFSKRMAARRAKQDLATRRSREHLDQKLDQILRLAERENRQGNSRALGDATRLIDDMKFYEKMDNIEYGQFMDKIEDFFRRYPGASDISSMNQYGGRLGR